MILINKWLCVVECDAKMNKISTSGRASYFPVRIQIEYSRIQELLI